MVLLQFNLDEAVVYGAAGQAAMCCREHCPRRGASIVAPVFGRYFPLFLVIFSRVYSVFSLFILVLILSARYLFSCLFCVLVISSLFFVCSRYSLHLLVIYLVRVQESCY